VAFAIIESAQDMFRAGLLRRSLEHLQSARSNDPESNALAAEIYLLQGRQELALRVARDLTMRRGLAEHILARAMFVAGASAWDLGDYSAGIEQLERAAAVAHKVSDASLVSKIRLHILEKAADTDAPYEMSVPLSATTVRAVHRSGDPQVLIEAHITFGRLEARIGHLDLAKRHLSLAKRLLQDAPNRWLAANEKLTDSIVRSLEGDIDSACEIAEQALEDASGIGWLKGEAIAAANLASYYVSLNRLTEASAFLAKAEATGYSLSNFTYALLDTKVALASVRGDGGESERLCTLEQNSEAGVASWYVLRSAHTRVRMLVAQQRFAEALQIAKHSFAEAVRLKNGFFRSVFSLSVAELEISDGPDLLQLAELSVPSNSLALLAVRRQILATALQRDSPERAAVESAAARRILRAAGSEQEWYPGNSDTSINTGELAVAAVSLDDAVALIELAGYPHVLAREAYALLHLTGAATALALVARGPNGSRRVESHGWTERHAADAAEHPDRYLRITCGQHRDEAWEILAELKPTLADRCAGVAVRKLVDTAVTLDRYRREEKQRDALWPADTLETDGGLWVSEQMSELLSIGRRIAPSDITVLLTGETGTGKEVLARAIHRASSRAAKPFVPFNCTAVPRDMLESQLFGYRRGAFTGADAAFDGVIRAAAGGTLFLDEIAEIGPDLQPKLLRFLETHEVHGLGEAHPVAVDVRVIGATNADLETLMADGRFREDLFYRLNVVRLRVPPLRERREEIPPLIDHYLHRFADEQKKGRLTLDDEALEYLLLFAWPGNVRQLVNEMRRLAAMADPDSTITAALLSPEIQTSRRTVRLEPGDEPEIRLRLDQPLNDAVDTIERALVRRALERAKGNYENAARLLGISRKGLFLKRRRWGMQRAS
jgi:DNA-binding NtrC family response regulator/tetratricopeptide (TPR) repeat protein